MGQHLFYILFLNKSKSVILLFYSRAPTSPPEHVGLAAQAGSELGEAAEVGLCGRTATAAAGLVGVLE